MLEGITVLNETSKHITNYSIWTYIAFTLGMILLIVCILLTFESYYYGFTSSLVVFWILFLGCGYFFVYNCNHPIKQFKYQEYKVTISDTLSKVDFDKHYKVISQEGKIYTIIKKEDEDKK